VPEARVPRCLLRSTVALPSILNHIFSEFLGPISTFDAISSNGCYFHPA
ncbi:hypothetical protein TorRG33x02_159790, partial [Trema orientale]